MSTFAKQLIEGTAAAVGILLSFAAVATLIWLMMLYPMSAEAAEFAPAPPVELPLAGVAPTEAQFHALARKALYAQDWDVVSAVGGVAVGKIYRTRFTTDPVNAELQWDDARKAYVYRVEVRLLTDRVTIGFLPSWGGKSDRLLRELRAEIAERLY